MKLKIMEPTILLIGKNLDTLKILKDELEKFDRNIVYANSQKLIEATLKAQQVDLIIVGAGLPNETINLMVELVERIAPKIELHIMEKAPGLTPASMIDYSNQKAIMWRLRNVKK